ncbi:endonuclease/exonuclease/phosphatase family protein [Asticcacaulis tiandongensis]|uniref:endonuclease/exonuclease/phosphatase family protein n=1 Tax=Asticcacaulis tiandongensis TaxID=2565365 RepID=UPI00112945D6|nr:endonuclease/exonuclease/phosphatase family protein [Asticcacaulis tiandongensis]
MWLAVSVVCLLNLPQAKAYLIDIFSAPLLTGAIICLGLLILLKQRLSALINLVAVMGLGFSLWGQMFPYQPKPDLTAQPVRLIFANLWIKNQTPEKLIAWIESENPDVVALVEVGPLAETNLIVPLKTRLPYVTHHHQTTLLSRFPISATDSKHIGYSTATATIDAPSGPLHLAVVHLTRPWPFTAPDAQPEQVRLLAQDFNAGSSERTVLVGDFNTTPSAAALSAFSQQTGFNPAGSRSGTWPAALPAPLRLGIDNVFAATGLSLKDRRTGPYYGSDHRPVRVDIYPAE